MKILRKLAPESVRRRKSCKESLSLQGLGSFCDTILYTVTVVPLQGPNHVWHVDGLDKLKQFGFSIHGCIDGYMMYSMNYLLHVLICICSRYSRRVLWLKVGLTNNDPDIIAHHYLKAVEETGGL